MYKKVKDLINGEELPIIQRLSDDCFIPFDQNNTDYKTYLKWLDGYEWQQSSPFGGEWVKTSDGNTPLPADE
jgi:hypothetical protein